MARCLTSTQRHCARNAFSSRESFSGFLSSGVPLVAIKYNAFNGSSSEELAPNSKN